MIIKFLSSGRGAARCAPDPTYPNGIALDASSGSKRVCTAILPYPAPECGLWVILCEACPMSVAVTAAGRPDDPTSVTMMCKRRENL